MYEIGRIFRNEGMDPKHNPEFTTVELYQAYADFNDMMDLFEELLSSAAQKILGTYQVEWQGEKIDLTPGWPRHDHGRGGQAVPGRRLYGHLDRRRGRRPLAKSVGVELPETATTPGATPSTSALTRRWRRSWFSRPLSRCTRWMSPPWPSVSPADPAADGAL